MTRAEVHPATASAIAPNPWPDYRSIPEGPRAVLAALHLTEPDREGLSRLSDAAWAEALAFADRTRLPLAVRRAAPQAGLPRWVRQRLEHNAAGNRERIRCIREIYREMQTRLAAAGIAFVALKGLTHCPHFCAAEERPQYDIDLYVPPAAAQAAQDVFLAWGYEPIRGMDSFPTDHLPALIRKTGWEWRGDYFDVEIPLAVEIHVRFWNEKLERLPAPGVEQFWERRIVREVAGLELPVLDAADALGYAALHFLRHLLQGSARPFHAYELACFLDARAGDAAFWQRWQQCHAPALRRLEAVSFRVAQKWFGSRGGPCVEAEIETLPEDVQAWLETFATAPLAAQFRPNKDELWLHLSLLHSLSDCLRVVRRRLLPLQIPGPVDAVFVPDSQMSYRRRLLQQVRRARFAARRAAHHLRVLPGVLVSGARWWWRTNDLGGQFWTFLAAAALFDVGLFIFVLLYNLYLLDLGYREDFLGRLSGVGTLGTVAGTLPAAWIARKLGMRRAFLAVIGASVTLVALRAVAGGSGLLLGLAFLWGLIFALWAVLIAPMIAATVAENRRPKAFSLFFASMIGVGAVGNWIGGRLPLWLHGKQPALLFSAVLIAAAAIPALWIRSRPMARERARLYPRSPFLLRYLAAFAIWNLATACFNPFTNVYFHRLNFAVEQIGTLFSASQLCQAGTLLLAPLVIRRLGLVPGIAWMMAGTAMALGVLAGQPAGAGAAFAYVAYMSVQWMSEPGLNTLLMNHVAEEEQGGASALNYLVAFLAQAAAAFVAGPLLAQSGYATVLGGAALLALAAAILFGLVVAGRSSAPSSSEARRASVPP